MAQRRWIQKVIRKPGALRALVMRRIGRGGFDSEGRIRCDVLQQLAREPGKTGSRARLALRLRGFGNVPCPVRKIHSAARIHTTPLRVVRVGPFTRERDFTVRQLRPGVWAWRLDDGSVKGVVSGPRTKREAKDAVRASHREMLYSYNTARRRRR